MRDFIRQKKRGFTLIELLVVIAIIGVLAGLLLPALSKARDRAKIVKCKSNVKQISYGFQMYMDDNNDYLPPCGGEPPLPAPPPFEWDQYLKWFHLLADYVDKKPAKQGGILKSAVWTCPSVLVSKTGGGTAHTGPSYIYTAQASRWGKTKYATYPAQAILFAGGNGYSHAAFINGSDEEPGSGGGGVCYRHADRTKAIFCFADLHIEMHSNQPRPFMSLIGDIHDYDRRGDGWDDYMPLKQ